jgi:chromosome segregation ATPase
MNQQQNQNTPIKTALTGLKTTIDTIAGKFSQLQQRYQQNQKQNMDKINEINALVDQIIAHPNLSNASLKEELRKTKRDLFAATETLKKCEQEKAQLQANVADIQKQLDTAANLNKEKQDLIDKLQKENADLNNKIQALIQEEGTLARNIDDLNAQLTQQLDAGLQLINQSFATEDPKTQKGLTDLKTKIEQVLETLKNNQPPPLGPPPSFPRGGGKKHRKQSRKKVKHGKKRRTQKRNKIQKGGYKYNNNKQLDEASSIISSSTSSKSKSYSNKSKSKSRNMRRSRK